MNKFKVGDRVRIVSEGLRGSNSDTRAMVGKVCEIMSIPSGRAVPYHVWNPNKSTWWSFEECELAPASKTWETLEAGDKILDDDGDPRTVLAVLPGLIAVSRWEHDQQDVFDDWLTPPQAERAGWKIDLQTPARTVELTLDEIADKFDVDVSNLRIKDQD